MGRRNGCNGKVRHKSQIGAIIAMKRKKNKGLHTYGCDVCGGWHIGTDNAPWKIQARITQLLSK